MARKTTNTAGLSQNAAGYYRRYLGLVKDDTTGDVKALHKSYSRDLAESKWMDAVWMSQRERGAKAVNVPPAQFTWSSANVAKISTWISEYIIAEREMIHARRHIADAERRLATGRRLDDRIESYQQSARLGVPTPGFASLPTVTVDEWLDMPGDPLPSAAMSSLVDMGILSQNPIAADAKSTTLETALAAYETFLNGNNEIESSTRKRSLAAVAEFRRYAGDLIPPISLDATLGLTYHDLERITQHIKSRPVSARTGEQLSAMTVKTTLQKWRELFDWIDKHEARFCWILPRRSVELFSVEIKRIEDKDERDARANGTNVIVPTLTEIKTLMDAGNDYQRMLILTAICGSLGQAELSCLRRGEMDLSTGAMRHRRNKSGVEGLHFLPPELCKRLGDYFEENPTVDGLAFKTRQGSVLVSDTSDSVQQWFLDLRAEVLADEKNAGKIRPEISFYDFRRVLANHPLVQKKHLSETALSQTHKTVANQKYVPNRDVQQSELWKISQKRFIPELRVAGILD